VLVYGLNFAGIQGKNNFTDRTAILALSGAYAGTTVYSVKHFTRHSRENPSLQRAFPSGHTTAAFAGAEFLAEEYGDQSIAYPIIGYSIAVATGVFRMYNHDHWFSEVVAGAGVGILSTRLAYLTYPYIRKWFTHTDKNGKRMSFVPTYQNDTPGFAFTAQF
ncbi:MAG: phosphatase PAP2 family protein, partial [Casimicrobiaceae bacterium]